MRVDIDVRGGRPAVDERHVRELAVFALSHMGVSDAAELSVSVVGPAEIQELNAQWRGRDTTTDVLSFPCDGAFADVADIAGAADMDGSGAADMNAPDAAGTGNPGTGNPGAAGTGGDGEGEAEGEGIAAAGIASAASGAPLELGDVVICPDVIDEQRAAFSTGFTEELSLMLVHSILHLLGYDHETSRERHAMEQREKEILDAFGLPGLR